MDCYTRMDKKLITRYAVRETMGLAVMGVALFWPAGRLDWWPAWAALGVMLAWTLATLVIIIRVHPGLLAERLGPRPGAKSWDTAILGALGVIQLGRYLVAGFDQRYGWTGGFPVGIQAGALAVVIFGYILVIWATATNAFFSQVVRLQTERGHQVVSQGPYHAVRHPAYIGFVLYELAVPALLGSGWAFIPGFLSAILLVLRTTLEDRTLQKELPGYSEYARKVPYRWVPGIW